jgi:hypothetical protein
MFFGLVSLLFSRAVHAFDAEIFVVGAKTLPNLDCGSPNPETCAAVLLPTAHPSPLPPHT